MIANLVKKDFLLVKKSVAAFLGISILVPLLVIILMRNTTQIQGIGMFVFLYMVILIEVIFMQAVATEEEKSPKAMALLCAAPFPKKLCYSKIYLLHDLLRGLYCYLLDYRRRLSWTWFFEYRGSAGGLFGGGNPLWGIYPYRN